MPIKLRFACTSGAHIDSPCGMRCTGYAVDIYLPTYLSISCGFLDKLSWCSYRCGGGVLGKAAQAVYRRGKGATGKCTQLEGPRLSDAAQTRTDFGDAQNAEICAGPWLGSKWWVKPPSRFDTHGTYYFSSKGFSY